MDTVSETGPPKLAPCVKVLAAANCAKALGARPPSSLEFDAVTLVSAAPLPEKDVAVTVPLIV
ncbi:MAG: hypothetical protein ABSF64_24315 [Bryobacteraceae bacterium]